VAIAPGLRKNHQLRSLRFPRELQLVIRVGQPTNLLERIIEVKRFGHRSPHFRDGLLELRQVEKVAEAIQNEVRHRMVDVDVLKLSAEQRFFILLIRHGPDGLGEAAARVDLDLVVGIDDAGTKDNGGDVPLARRPQTHDDPDRTGGNVALVVMGNDRRIEQRRGFDRILRGQVGSDQHPAIARAVVRLVRLAGDFQGRPVVLVEHGSDFAVAGAELEEHLVQQAVDLFVAQGAHALEDVADPSLSAGVEEASNDAAKIAAERDRQTPDFQGTDVSFSVVGSRHAIVAGDVAQDVLSSFQHGA